MKNSLMTKSLIALSSLFVGFSAQAYLIDFTNGDWTGPWDPVGVYEVDHTTPDGVFFTVKLEADPTALNGSEAYDGPTTNKGGWDAPTAYCNDNALECLYDGVGIVDDEVSTDQSLTVTFWDENDEQLSGNIDSIILLDLYPRGTCDASDSDDYAAFSLTLGDPAVDVDGLDCILVDDSMALEGGFYTINPLVPGEVDTLTLFGDDFALAGLEVSGSISIRNIDPEPVSEPETLALFGLGLLGLGMSRRRSKK